MPAKLIWQSDSWPANPTSGTSDRPTIATATIFWTATASGADTTCAAIATAATNAAAVAKAPDQAGRGITSREVRVLWPRRRLSDRANSTTNSRSTGMAKRNCAISTVSVGRYASA
jgi:hypothetical protein